MPDVPPARRAPAGVRAAARLRRPVALAALALALVGLAGCTRPTPIIGAFSDGTAISVDALQYCWNGPTSCRAHAASARSLTVRPNSTVQVDVPGELSRSSWQVAVLDPGAQLKELGSLPVQHDSHYLRFSSAANGGKAFVVEVRQAAAPGSTTTVGIWRFLVTERQ